MKMFDFCVRQRKDGFHAIFSRVWLKDGAPPPDTELWTKARNPSGRLSNWGQPIQIMTAEGRGWHAGPWKSSFRFHHQTRDRAFVFFDGSYRTKDPGPFPFAFALGCLEIDLPLDSASNRQTA
jgi:hypothetical protein